MYVVGMRAYDQFSQPVRGIYTFIKGPIRTLAEAKDICNEVSDNIFNSYSKAMPKGTSFLIKEQEEDITLYQLINGIRHPLVTVSARYYEPKVIDEKNPDRITKEMKMEAQKKLATINLYDI